MAEGIDIRPLHRSEIVRIAEIDRTERIDMLCRQDGETLIEQPGSWDADPWDAEGDGPHSVAAKVREIAGYVDLGGVVLGASAGDRLVGIGVVIPAFRRGVAQLAFLHVSARSRGNGVGASLSAQLDDIARAAGATEMVVSATPSRNTVTFYLRRGFTPMRQPYAELADLEPDDIHLHKTL